MLARAFSSAASRWSTIPVAKPDAILGLTVAFNADTHPQKINLGAGTFRTEQGKPYVLGCVRKAEEALLSQNLDHEYLPISGLAPFCANSAQLALGQPLAKTVSSRLVSAQSISGTGALWMLATFLGQWRKGKTMLVPNPTWGNHKAIFAMAGVPVQDYRYWSAKSSGLDFAGMCEDLSKAPEGAAVLLHACAHNPTGVDPTQEQWRELSSVVKKRGLLAFFDMAYQGFASGDPAKDAFAVRHFVAEGHDIMLTQSYAKNFGLYGERVGAAHILTASDAEQKAVDSQLKLVIRPAYSNPPIYGARVVNHVLNSPALTEEWAKELQFMSGRIIKARKQLRDELAAVGSTRNWEHITSQIGMFSYLGITTDQVNSLIKDYHIYLTQDGRISMSGVNPANVKYLAEALHKVTKN
jgi:aspartate aminotransferase